MAGPLARFDPPADWREFPLDGAKEERLRAAWHEEVSALTRASAGGNYYDPLVTDLGDAQPERVEWTAFPKPVADAGSGFAAADDREAQGEYCEWCVARRADGKIVRVVFTSETPEYWQTLWEIDSGQVLALYRRLVSPAVQIEHLRDGSGNYLPRNRWNVGGEYRADRGGIVHYVVGINTLAAAVGVVAGAANSSGDSPRGGHRFHADPLIDLTVKRVVQRLGARVSFSNPVGIYLQEPQFHRFELPASAPRTLRVEDCWRVVRGDRRTGRALHAVFEVPRSHRFVVGDMKVDGRPIQQGSQIARALKSGTYVTPVPRT